MGPFLTPIFTFLFTVSHYSIFYQFKLRCLPMMPFEVNSPHNHIKRPNDVKSRPGGLARFDLFSLTTSGTVPAVSCRNRCSDKSI